MTTHAQTIVALTQPQAEAILVAALVGTPAQGWSLSSPQRKLVGGFAAFLSYESTLRAGLGRAMDLRDVDATDPDWIDVFAAWFGLTRIPALAAVWDVPMTGTTLPLTVQPSTKITLQATGGIFLDLTQSAAAPLPASLRFAARVAGTGGNVTPSTISAGRIITGPAGLTFNGTPVRVTQGRAQETNAQLVRRMLGRWARLGAGWTAQAFDDIIPTAAQSVYRWAVDDSNPIGPGSVVVHLDATTQEVANVQAALGSRSVKPLGSGTFLAQLCGSHAVTFSAVLAEDGSNPTVIADATAALALLEAALPLGADVDEALLVSVLRGLPIGAVDVDTIGGTTERVTVGAPGFGGVTGVTITGTWTAAPAASLVAFFATVT